MSHIHRPPTQDDLHMQRQMAEAFSRWSPLYIRMLGEIEKHGRAMWRAAQEQKAPALGLVMAAVDQAQEIFNEALAVRKQQIACTEGCSFCCYLQVEILPFEAEAIVEYLAYSGKTAGELMAYLMAAWSRMSLDDLSCAEYRLANEPCLFLENGRCSIYPVRPLACVQYHSSDRACCERAATDRTQTVPMWAEPSTEVNMLRVGLFNASGQKAEISGFHELLALTLINYLREE